MAPGRKRYSRKAIRGIRFLPNAYHGLREGVRLAKNFKNRSSLKRSPRVKTLHSRSKTQTTTKNNGGRRRGPHMDDAASSSITIKGRRKMNNMLKGFKKVLGPRIVRGSTTTKLATFANQQSSVELNCFATSSVQTHIGGFYDLREIMDNLLVDEYQGTVSNTTSYKTMKWFISKIRVVHRIRNMTSAPVNLTLYDIVARKDQTLAITPSQAWSDGLDETRVTAAFPNTYGSGPVTTGRVGVTPFMSPEFCKLFKVKKVNEFTLHPGVTHKHYVTLYPNKLWNGDESALFSYHSGITTFTLVTIKGDVGQDSTPLVPRVVYTQGTVEVISEYQAKAFMFNKNKSLTTWYDNFDTVVGPIKQIVEDTDVLADVEMVS